MNAYDEQAHLAQLEALYGPEYRYSEYKRGDVITYRSADSGMLKTETIDYVATAREVRGRSLPARYIVAGFDVVFFSEIIAREDA